ncbi:TPA: hypothetical protein ACKR1B_003360 [Pseudomonas aeruginosa]|uniref:hypothetical protein n=1 Tax=Pseudomonas aeruginosa TaxID=287 RepID=UPI00053EAD0F|nr:hypothetical protein [Pseudomonas aeruginosa]ELH7348759.1 hypothetical protein [Pseudomonas aeruginosa]ELO2038775.1 hypothetical protein [Pseudomonas aeruginosa]KAB5405664.1 hypothetical protein F8139_29025 [Pseudomonas aeruginosa]MCO2142479.1 hypothetical protein [Pseudomonas aeruginosa]MCO2172134.1 hypothetical protein [Pseudomonas aeruginosa]
MSGNMIPFGERDGQLFQADEVANGLGCGCVCPECQRALVAANEGTKVLPYFRHQQRACEGGHAAGVRRKAIELIVAELQLQLPPFSQAISAKTMNGFVIRKVVSFESSLLQAERADAGVKLSGVTADVVLTAGEHQLLVYVRAAKRQDRQKESALLALGVSVMELDISHLGLDTILDKDAFRQAVLFDLRARRWLHTVRGTMMVERARQAIQAEIDQRNELEKQQKLKELEQRRLEREQMDAELEMARARNEALRVASQAARVAAFEAQQKSPEALAERARRESLKQESGRRAEVIVATIRMAIESWGGAGAECQRCYLISEADTEACGYCASTGPFKAVSFTQDYLGSAQARMRSSHKPDTSVAQVPILSQEPGAAG